MIGIYLCDVVIGFTCVLEPLNSFFDHHVRMFVFDT